MKFYIYMSDHPTERTTLRAVRDDAGIDTFEQAVEYANRAYGHYPYLEIMDVAKSKRIHY